MDTVRVPCGHRRQQSRYYHYHDLYGEASLLIPAGYHSRYALSCQPSTRQFCAIVLRVSASAILGPLHCQSAYLRRKRASFPGCLTAFALLRERFSVIVWRGPAADNWGMCSSRWPCVQFVMNQRVPGQHARLRHMRMRTRALTIHASMRVGAGGAPERTPAAASDVPPRYGALCLSVGLRGVACFLFHFAIWLFARGTPRAAAGARTSSGMILRRDA